MPGQLSHKSLQRVKGEGIQFANVIFLTSFIRLCVQTEIVLM